LCALYQEKRAGERKSFFPALAGTLNIIKVVIIFWWYDDENEKKEKNLL
jgi:hypothetical protein